MDELLALVYLQIDWITVIAFFVIALFYFLAPVLGYTNSNRLLVVTALGALVIKMGMAFCRIALIHFERFDRGGSFPNFGGGNNRLFGGNNFLDLLVTGLMPPMEIGLFILALVVFSLWLFGLERQQLYPEPLSRSDQP